MPLHVHVYSNQNVVLINIAVVGETSQNNNYSISSPETITGILKSKYKQIPVMSSVLQITKCFPESVLDWSLQFWGKKMVFLCMKFSATFVVILEISLSHFYLKRILGIVYSWFWAHPAENYFLVQFTCTYDDLIVVLNSYQTTIWCSLTVSIMIYITVPFTFVCLLCITQASSSTQSPIFESF